MRVKNINYIFKGEGQQTLGETKQGNKTYDIDDSAGYMSGSKDAHGLEAKESTINQQHYIGSNERDDVNNKKIMLSIITTSYTIK